MEVTESSVYQVKIQSLNTPYPAWRRILAPGCLNLHTFKYLMIHAMGWRNCHMSSLIIDEQQYGSPFPGSDILQAKDYFVYKKLKKGDELYLWYDFGDDWEHLITVEEIFPKKLARMKVPSCLEGEGACPPDDCGGEYGICNLVHLMEHPDDDIDQYHELVSWLGYKFDKTAFNIKAINKAIAQFKK